MPQGRLVLKPEDLSRRNGPTLALSRTGTIVWFSSMAIGTSLAFGNLLMYIVHDVPPILPQEPDSCRLTTPGTALRTPPMTLSSSFPMYDFEEVRGAHENPLERCRAEAAKGWRGRGSRGSRSLPERPRALDRSAACCSASAAGPTSWAAMPEPSPWWPRRFTAHPAATVASTRAWSWSPRMQPRYGTSRTCAMPCAWSTAASPTRGRTRCERWSPRRASGGRFFSRVVTSGSHPASVAAVARGEADVAAIDCVTYALLDRYLPFPGSKEPAGSATRRAHPGFPS